MILVNMLEDIDADHDDDLESTATAPYTPR